MNGLRVYVNGEIPESRGGRQIFYSRREDGPYYRWSYDDNVTQWRVDRMSKSGISPKALAAATWKHLPVALQRNIIDHYQD